jgi:hypothetical protein
VGIGVGLGVGVGVGVEIGVREILLNHEEAVIPSEELPESA